MKHVKQLLLSVLAGFAYLAQAAKAEFGEQVTWPGLKAEADLQNYQYRVVRGTGSDDYVNVCSQTAVTSLGPRTALGVLQNNPRAEEAATVAFQGLSKAVVGTGGMTFGMPVTHNASGQVIDAVSGAIVIGRAMETIATVGQIGTVMLFPPIRWGAIL
jgi:hypothetical protein